MQTYKAFRATLVAKVVLHLVLRMLMPSILGTMKQASFSSQAMPHMMHCDHHIKVVVLLQPLTPSGTLMLEAFDTLYAASAAVICARWSTARRPGTSTSSSTLWQTPRIICLLPQPGQKPFWGTLLWQCTQRMAVTSISLASSALCLSWTGQHGSLGCISTAGLQLQHRFCCCMEAMAMTPAALYLSQQACSACALAGISHDCSLRSCWLSKVPARQQRCRC